MRWPHAVLLVLAAALAASAQERGKPRPSAQAVAREVDALLEKAWRDAGVEPVEPASDAAFLRRLSLDIEGVIPDERTVTAALERRGDRVPDRGAWVRGLLHGQGFGRFMGQRWGNLLIGRRAVLETLEGEQRELSLVAWLAQQAVGNARWDAVVRDLLAPPVERTGPALYRARFGGQVEEVTGNLLRTFQGLPLQCAQCHDHPFHEQWKQRDFWGVAAFLVDGPRVQVPGTDLRVEPRFLGGETPAAGADKRRELARILTAPSNPYFARATVNRVWSFFFGRAFQDPDDLTQAPRLPDVLARLERDFVESGHDLRRLCEVILSTRAYGLASTGPAATKDAQLAVFARARLRTLSPEQLWASLARAAGLDEGEDEAARSRRADLRREFYRVFADAPEGTDQHSITQALSLLNGPVTNAVSRVGEGAPPAMTRLLAMGSFDDQLGSLYLRVVGRPPTRAERQALRATGLSSDERAQLLGDVWWALLNSSEFVNNH